MSLFPVAEKRAEQVLPVLQAELAKKATYSWNDPPLDPSWTEPDATLVSRIESAQGMLAERFAFCQTMPLDEFVTTAEALRKSGYRPVRFRPYADGRAIRVAAVWTRDGRNWRISSGLTAEEVRQQDDRNKKDKFVPVDVAGYLATEKDGKPADRYAALWVEKSGDDEARLYVGTTADEQTEVQDKLKEAKLIPRTLHAMIGSEGRPRYCGVWGRPPGAAITGQVVRDQFEGNFEQQQADLSDRLLIDMAVSGASKPLLPREIAQTDLQRAEKKLKAEIMTAGHPDRRYDAAWSSDASFEAIPIYGLEPAAHLSKCRELIAQGYRPVSWSVNQTAANGPLVTASVWHRPVITEETRDRLAERQARAAVALVRIGKAEEVWPLLRHSADPRLRSFIVNWLNPLGADPKLIAAELDRMDSPDTHHTPPATQKMDAILFHPETSQRRALILALGTYGMEGLSPGEKGTADQQAARPLPH